MYYNLQYEDLARVKPEQMQRYLEATGWKKVNDVSGKFFVYRLPADNDSEILVPVDPQFRDYTRRLAEAIYDLAEYQSVVAESVLSDLIKGMTFEDRQ